MKNLAKLVKKRVKRKDGYMTTVYVDPNKGLKGQRSVEELAQEADGYLKLLFDQERKSPRWHSDILDLVKEAIPNLDYEYRNSFLYMDITRNKKNYSVDELRKVKELAVKYINKKMNERPMEISASLMDSYLKVPKFLKEQVTFNKMRIRETFDGSYYQPSENQIFLYPTSVMIKSKEVVDESQSNKLEWVENAEQEEATSMVHEYAHAYHNNMGIITNNYIDPKVKEAIRITRSEIKEVDDVILNGIIPINEVEISEEAIAYKSMVNLDRLKDGFNGANRYLKSKGVEHVSYDQYVDVCDILMAVNPLVGVGHDVTYLTTGVLDDAKSGKYTYKDENVFAFSNYAAMEYFAHTAEYSVFDNKLLQTLLPKTAKAMKDLWGYVQDRHESIKSGKWQNK